ncbi:MAG: nucleoside monophosphate kinase [Candidatus Pacebacteria bacterium]|nr:nucleoside monophosphate kinase [Candidatus Paceibacterota bacterium]MBP9852252.1 nucleoside monophosphate kinase [Candidatus Paceibacterota bacterium]
MNPQTIILMGRSGCGKGTQAKLVQEYLKQIDPSREIFYLETGQQFRDFISQNTYTSNLSKKIMESGDLQPAFLAIHIWSHVFIEQMKGNENMVLDGTPRTLSEIEALDTAFKFYNRETPTVFVIDVSKEWSKTRLLERGRIDDSRVGDMEKRLEWFDTDVVPAIRHMEEAKMYKVVTINGEQSIDKVHADIIAVLEAGK